MAWKLLIINLICCIAFPIFVFWKVKIYGRNFWNTEALTKDDTYAIRGIAALFVLFAHLLIAMSEAGIGDLGPAVLYKWCGGLGVCVFFFMSGYGLWISCEKKRMDITFLKKRCIGLLPTYFLIRILAIVLLKKSELGIGYTILYLFSLTDSAWFVVEIFIIYFIFYFAKKYGKNHAILWTFITLVIVSIVFLLLDFEPRWYNANLNFGFGILLARYKNEYFAMVMKTEKRFWVTSAGTLMLFGVTAIAFIVFKGFLLANMFKLLAGGFFSLCLIHIVLKLNIHSKGLLYIGKYSLQIYLLHSIVIEWFGQRLNSDTNLLIVFLTELVISLLIFVVYCWCENKVFITLRKSSIATVVRNERKGK